MNGYWICDEGRYGYKSVDDLRVPKPSLLSDGKAGAMAWEDAFKLAAGELSELCRTRGHQGLAVVLSGSLSNEDIYAARELFVERLKAGHILLQPGPDQLGEEDGLLRRKERVPNLRGAQALGFGTAIRESSLDEIRKGLLSGDIWGVYAVDRDPQTVLGDGIREALLALPFSLHQTANSNAFTQSARWVLPSCSYAEEDATFVNFEGRAQRVRRALRPFGESKPDWEIFAGLLRALGSAFEHEDAASVFGALSSKEPSFRGLMFDLPPNGEPLR